MRNSTRPTRPAVSRVCRVGGIRACSDSKYGLVNMRAADFTPITRPTWDHIGQIASDLPTPPREWSFMKAGRKAAYKNSPLNPNQSQFCIVAPRSPGDSNWYGFARWALLFGAPAAVRHYNCFSRVAAVIINRLFGLPFVNKFPDIGSMVLSSLSGDGIRLLIKVFPFSASSLRIGRRIYAAR